MRANTRDHGKFQARLEQHATLGGWHVDVSECTRGEHTPGALPTLCAECGADINDTQKESK